MFYKTIILVYVFWSGVFTSAGAQTIKAQQGLLLKSGTAIRLGSVQVFDKRTHTKAISNVIGVFNIQATAGDTLTFNSENFQTANFVVGDFADKIIYLEPVIQLNEVTVKEYSLRSNIKEVQRGYREKSVFYTGTPHYYYLFLKPMTFIYENFKSEEIDARRFNRYARRELAACKVGERFNDAAIKSAIPIKDSELDDFKVIYAPTLEQINRMNDYDLVNYIRACYRDLKKNIIEQIESKI